MRVTTANILALAEKIKTAYMKTDRSTSWIDLEDGVVLVDIFNHQFKGLTLFVKDRPIGILKDDILVGPIEPLKQLLKEMFGAFISKDVDTRAFDLFKRIPDNGIVEANGISITVGTVGYTTIKVTNISFEGTYLVSYPWAEESKPSVDQAILAKLRELIRDSILSGGVGTIAYSIEPYTAPVEEPTKAE